MYASYLMLEGSSCDLFAPRVHFSNLLEGTGDRVSEVGGDSLATDGIRKGSTPVGDAWLLDGTISNPMFKNLRYA